MNIILEFFLVPAVAWIVWRVAHLFRTPEYDREKRRHPGHWL